MAAASAEARGARALIGTIMRSDLALLISGSAAARLGTMSTFTALPLLSLELTGSAWYAGLVTAAGTFPYLLFHLPAGVVADKFDRRRIMYVGLLGRAVTFGVLAGGLWVLADPILLIPIAAAVAGVCAVFYQTAEAVTVSDIAAPEELEAATSKNEVQNHTTPLVGRPLGGMLFGVNQVMPFLFDLATASLAALALRRITGQEAREDDDPAPRKRLSRTDQFRRMRRWLRSDPFMRRSLEEGWRWLRSDLFMRRSLEEGWRWLRSDLFMRRSLAICVITNLLFQMITLLLIILAKERQMSGSSIGVLLAASGAGGIVGAAVARPVLGRIQLDHTTVVCCWAWLLLTLIMLISSHPWVLMLVLGGVGFVGAHMNVAHGIHLGKRVPAGLRGRAAGFRSFTMRAPQTLGSLGGGLMISAFGAIHAPRWVVGAMSVLTITITVRWLILPKFAGTLTRLMGER